MAISKIMFLLSAILLPFSAAASSFYQPDTPVEIITEMTINEMPGSSSDMIQILVNPVISDSPAYKLNFLNAKSGNTFGQLIFSRSGQVEWVGGSKKNSAYSGNGLIILPGSTLPVDVLPVKMVLERQEPLFYEFERMAGGRTFADQIFITVEPVSLGRIRSENWLRLEGAEPSSFYMIEAKDVETKELVVRQLWSHESVWWIFEQTPYRRSWRVR
jgi:hypothetical protein